MDEGIYENVYIQDLIHEVRTAHKDDYIEIKRVQMIDIASINLVNLFEIIGDSIEARKEYDWLIRDIIRIWGYKITEVPKRGYKSKYKQQKYWTRRALLKYMTNEGKFKGLVHEHVYTIKSISDKLVKIRGNENQIKQELKKATSCIVTSCEHKKLHKNRREGWERYNNIAGIEVVDLLKRK